MGGTPKSRGCQTCRQRKIKCDEAVPTCGQCRRSQRHCPGLTVPLKFVDEAVKAREKAKSTEPVFRPLPANSMWYQTDSPAANGSLFQKWHRSDGPVAITPPPRLVLAVTQTETLCNQLVSCFQDAHPDFGFDQIGGWLKSVPPRLGCSQALDDAVACMAGAHASMIRHDVPALWINREKYNRALRSLQGALSSPVEGFSANTLAATAVLFYVEAIAGSTSEFDQIYHAGGVSRLLEARGPLKHQDGFERAIALQLHGPIIAQAVQVGTDCFLASPAWEEVMQPLGTQSRTDELQSELNRAIVYWPGILRDTRSFYSNKNEVFFQSLMSRLVEIYYKLDTLGQKLQMYLDDSTSATYCASGRNDPLVPFMLKFTDVNYARVYAFHAGYMLLVGHILKEILAYAANFNPPAIADWRDIIHSITTDSPALSHRIWMTYEYTCGFGSIVSQLMHMPLVATYEFAPLEMQTWIINSLNNLDGYRQLRRERYSPPIVIFLAMLYTGEAPAILSLKQSGQDN